ncbi:MAG TPA: FAD-binding oxidoreductase [Acetobacteraceae bacterium]|nr:FAD-binding oxidoreductase [Acetobacteraceae bacterium]
MPETVLPAISPLLAEIRDIVGDRGLLTDPADSAPYCEDWRRLYQGHTPAVVRPATTRETAAVVRLCAQAGVAIVPQGGNTSMVGGAVPAEDGSQLVLSTTRLNRVRDIDTIDLTMTIEAGVTLKAAQLAAADAGCLLPLSISSEGSAQIGGVLAANAGGNNTVRYGNARDLVLGLEVVLADGSIWNGLRRLRKDNTGYCLRQLFVGSEGTLGIITAAVLKLAPRPRETAVAFCAVPTPEAALALFARFQAHDAATISAFELMSGLGTDFVLKRIEGATLPLAQPSPFYALVELATPRPKAGLDDAMELILEDALGDGVITDAAIAESEAQRAAIWRLREEHSEAQKREGASVKNDVSVPVSKVPEFIRRATEACERLMPGIRAVPFGHMGDGNIHFNLEQPEDADPDWFLAQDHAIMDTVNEVVRALDGSFSAEHGIGKLKPYMMPDWRGGVELTMMQLIKAALDPRGILNPGKVLPSPAVQPSLRGA